MSESERVDAAVVAERRQLVAVAFRLLGTIAEAEDAVQESYARWYRLTPAEREAVRAPGAWLTRVVSRVCLDVLGSARARRERYVGEWLPEPVPADALAEVGPAVGDPADRVTLDESVSTALLVVLEAMTPAERVAFVLHDVFAMPFGEIAGVVGRTPAACRQLAASARSRVQGVAARRAPREEHDRVVRAFAAAAGSGDLAALVAVLDPTVELRSDGGGFVSAARRPVLGSDNVARFLMGIAAKRPHVQTLPLDTRDGLGFAAWDDGRIISVGTLQVEGGRITHVRIQLNPEKLTFWR